MHNMSLSTTVVPQNNIITLSKATAAKALNNIKDGLVSFIRMLK